MNTEWKLVPVEPTPKMIKAWHDAYSNAVVKTGRSGRAYAAMLDAAPCPTCNDQGEVGNILTAQPCPDCSPPAPTSHPIPTGATGEDERQPDLCPRCDGSGEVTVLSDNSPDAHDVNMPCDHCQGSGAAVDAAKYLAAALSGEKFRHSQLYWEFRNFHRSLCARFGYGHDPVHFRRDLVSLEEAIASKVSAPAAGDALDLTLTQKYEDACIAANANARDAERWRAFERALRTRIAGPGHGTRIEVVTICPMFGEEKDVPDVRALIDAAIAQQKGEA